MPEKSAALFTIVIPTYNRAASLVHTLENLSRQTYQPFEVVVVVDGGSDDTAERLDALGPTLPYPLRYVVQANAGPARARNHGAELAQGHFILFMDDDIEALPELVAQHARVHAEADGRIVIGITPAPPDGLDSAWAIYEATTFAKHYNKLSSGVWEEAGPRLFYTGNSSLARATFWQVGGFDETLRRGEDIELGYRLQDAGFKFFLNERASGLHLSAPRSLPTWKRIPYLYGRLDARLDLDKDRYGMVAIIGADFAERHLFNRWLVRLCLNQPGRSRLANWVLDRIALSGRGKIAQRACSALFNLNYYQGLIEELGAAQVWWANTDPAMAQAYANSPRPLVGISVVVFTEGRQPVALRQTLEALLASGYPNLEVLVADLGEPAPTAELLASFGNDSRLRHLTAVRPGRVESLELALKLAAYPILAATEEGCEPAATWLTELERIFSHRAEVGLVVGPVAAAEGSNGPAFAVEQTRYIAPDKLRQPGGYGSSVNLALRRAVFKRLESPVDPAQASLTLRAAQANVIALDSTRPVVTRQPARRLVEPIS